jgi:hypothetical protein
MQPVHILVRHCYASEASASKARPTNFNRKRLFEQLLQSLHPVESGKYDLTVLLDTDGTKPPHFTHELQSEYMEMGMNFKIICVNGGCERSSFRNCLTIALNQGWKPTDIVVFLEDDYAVSQNWLSLIEEGLSYGNYVTLYDHPDKYSAFLYPNLLNKLYLGKTRHWRSTPSTTNSYACTLRTLQEDIHVHQSYSEGYGVTNDHQKFLQLWNMDRSLVSCIPGAWSHEEVGMQSRI